MGREIERLVAMGRSYDGNYFLDILISSATTKISAFQRRLTIDKVCHGAVDAAFGNRIFSLCLEPAAGWTKKQDLKFLCVPFSHS